MRIVAEAGGLMLMIAAFAAWAVLGDGLIQGAMP